MPRILLTVPSYRGISDKDALELVGGEALQRAGLQMAVVVIGGMAMLDRARNELLAIAYHSGADYMLTQDDDAKTEAGSVRNMVRLCEEYGFPVLAAPVQMRGDGSPNVALSGGVLQLADGSRVAPISWMGLGSVLFSRRALEAIVTAFKDEHYRLEVPGQPAWNRAWNVHASRTVPAEGAPGERDLLSDDRILSKSLETMGMPMRAYLDAVTDHAGMGRYCMGDMVE